MNSAPPLINPLEFLLGRGGRSFFFFSPFFLLFFSFGTASRGAVFGGFLGLIGLVQDLRCVAIHQGWGGCRDIRMHGGGSGTGWIHSPCYDGINLYWVVAPVGRDLHLQVGDFARRRLTG